MFLLLVVLSGLKGLQADQDSQKTFLQTTVPEKISSPDVEKDPENHVAYLITLAGKPYFVHLKKQSFLSPTAAVYSYDKNGTQQSQSLSALTSCNYNGYVAGFPNSLVAFSICSGLRLGTIQFKSISYGIEPMEAVWGFAHMIYKSANSKISIPVFAENDTYWFNQSQHEFRNSVNRSEFTKLSPRCIEMDIVVDKSLFDYMGSDIKAVTQKVIQIIGLVNTMLSKLKLTVLISSIEIWSNKNKISTTGDLDRVLYRFLDWKHSNLDHEPHHISYLLSFEERPSSIGATYPGMLCSENSNGAVILYPKGLSLESYSVIVVQLLGLGLGLTYDDADACFCSGDVCTMTPEAVYSEGTKDFSSCSLDDFKYFTSHNDLQCLRDIPVERRRPPPKPPRWTCGNGVVEGKEQCDCGTLKNCTHKNCCDPMSCRLKHKAICGSGECCGQDCTLEPIDTPCRKTVDECDFPEYCNGNLSYCVADTYARDGQPCDSGGAFCYQGLCRTFDKQCTALLGKPSTGASFGCFEEMNSRGDRFGNCGRISCIFQNSLCGKLVCSWPYKRLLWRANLSVVYAHVRDEICISTYKGGRIPKNTPTTYLSKEDRDETFVEDGSICGPEMYCLNMECKETRFLIDYKSCDSSITCSGNGICNNFQHCHCNKGFFPPFCEKKEGEFGSIDDGHLYHIPGRSNLQKKHGISGKHWYQLIFYISLPVTVVIIAAIIKQSKLIELCSKEEPESYRYIHYRCIYDYYYYIKLISLRIKHWVRQHNKRHRDTFQIGFIAMVHFITESPSAYL
uniref:A disintegrin and metallopeptidase domain 5 n=1 Tax=Nannospalax galili TaxID=1026970 RepID=A0A8C6QUN7_NANGA